jgi:hypothetical protein
MKVTSSEVLSPRSRSIRARTMALSPSLRKAGIPSQLRREAREEVLSVYTCLVLLSVLQVSPFSGSPTRKTAATSAVAQVAIPS